MAPGAVDYVERPLARDEGPRAGSSLEALAGLRPVFAARGSVTAGNSSQMSDGAGAVLVVSEAALKTFDLTPSGIIRSLKLRRPIYFPTASHGHFGRKGANFTWEQTNKAAALRKACGLK